MSKLTLSIDDRIISRAKRYAKQQGLSVSEIVETYLASVSEPAREQVEDLPPVLKSVRGLLKHADREDYRKHLLAKHR